MNWSGRKNTPIMLAAWSAARFDLPRVARSKKQAELERAEILDRCREIARVFATVEDMLRAKNLGTFGHMITGAPRSAEK